jgi:ribulose-phosphate 3-epimerase
LKISASIISANFSNLKEEFSEAKAAGIDWLHIDVMDGVFVPNITIGPLILPVCKQITNLPLDVHLMITHPELHIPAFAKAGANRISVHAENNPNIFRTLQQIRELGVSPGIVLNPGTPVNAIEFLLPFVDMVLIMSVNPGFSGQKFIAEMIQKIELVRDLIDRNGYNVLIEVDGGINKDTVKRVVDAGADVIVAATAIFGHPQGITAGVNELREAL